MEEDPWEENYNLRHHKYHRRCCNKNFSVCYHALWLMITQYVCLDLTFILVYVYDDKAWWSIYMSI